MSTAALHDPNRSVDQKLPFDDGLTFGERLADRVAAFGGSWTFIILFWLVLIVWIVLNSYVLRRAGDSFDPYPYILLNLILSMLAAFQAPIIMMSQNRQAAKDRQQAARDYEVNRRAEYEISQLHAQLDHLHQEQLELLEIQREQIRIVTTILQANGRYQCLHVA